MPRVGFSIFLLLSLLVIVDQVIALAGWPAWPNSDGAIKGVEAMICYSSDPESRFPMDITESSEDQAVARRVAKDQAKFEQLFLETPHCVLRDEDETVQGLHPERPRKLFVMGDSFTAGFGLPLNRSIGPALEERLPHLNVRNISFFGASLHDVEIGLSRLYRGQHNQSPIYQASEGVIYFFNLNDLEGADRALNLSQATKPPGWGVAGSSLEIALNKASGLYRAWLIIKHRREVSNGTVNQLNQAYLAPENRPKVDRAVAALVRLNKLAKKTGKPLLVVIWPLGHHDLSGDYPFTAIHAMLMSRCKAAGVRCLDGLPAYAGQNATDLQVHPSDSHPSELAVSLLADFLVKSGQVPGGKK